MNYFLKTIIFFWLALSAIVMWFAFAVIGFIFIFSEFSFITSLTPFMGLTCLICIINCGIRIGRTDLVAYIDDKIERVERLFGKEKI